MQELGNIEELTNILSKIPLLLKNLKINPDRFNTAMGALNSPSKLNSSIIITIYTYKLGEIIPKSDMTSIKQPDITKENLDYILYSLKRLIICRSLRKSSKIKKIELLNTIKIIEYFIIAQTTKVAHGIYINIHKRFECIDSIQIFADSLNITPKEKQVKRKNRCGRGSQKNYRKKRREKRIDEFIEARRKRPLDVINAHYNWRTTRVKDINYNTDDDYSFNDILELV